MENIIFWWSVISTVLSVVFLGVSIWQIVDGRKQKERSNAQVKIWMQDANGIVQGLARMIQINYSTTEDIKNSIYTLHASAFALYQSLFEERAVTEEEFREQQKQIAKDVKKAFQQQQAVQSRSAPSQPVEERARQTEESTSSSTKGTGNN